jgi:hypothetical protein
MVRAVVLDGGAGSGRPLAAQAEEVPPGYAHELPHRFVARLIAGESPDHLARLMVAGGAQSSAELAAGLRSAARDGQT